MMYLFVIVVLLLLSGLISGSESAFFSLKPKDTEFLRESQTKQSKMVIHWLNKPKDLLAIILVLNNFVNVGIVILSSILLKEVVPNEFPEYIKLIIDLVGITLVILMLGEVVPKVFASQNPDKVALFMALPLFYTSKIPPFSMLSWLLVKGSNIIQTFFGNKTKVSTVDLEQAIALTKEENSNEEEHKLLEGIVKFSKTEANQIMTPRIEVEALSVETNFPEVIAFILDAGYSRVPVYEETEDNVIGILYIKDLLPFLGEKENYAWQQHVRKPYFVPENKKINDLLQEFRTMKMHMAVLVDEYGGACGIVTLEDILEEIVGDITDEFDDQEVIYTKIDEKNFLFEGRTSLNDFYKIVDVDSQIFEDKKGEAETLGGFIIEQAGRILRNNEFIEIESYKLIVESSDKRRIKTVKVKIL